MMGRYKLMNSEAKLWSVSADVNDSDMNNGTAVTRGPIEKNAHSVQLVSADTASENALERAHDLRNLTVDHSRKPLMCSSADDIAIKFN